MFGKLEKKIKIILMAIIILGTLVTALTVNLTIRKNIFDHSVQLTQQHIRQQNQNLRLNMNLIEETSRLVSENATVKESLETTGFSDRVIPLLDSLRASNLSILGVTVYGVNGALYISSNAYHVPAYEEIKPGLAPPDGHSSGDPYWAVRIHGIPGFYNYASTSKTGIFTCIIPMKSDQKNLLGYVLIDTNILSIYDFYKPDDSGMFYNKSSVYLVASGGKLLPSPFNPPGNIDLPQITGNMGIASGEKKYILGKNNRSILTYNPIPNSKDVVAVSTPLNLNGQLRTLVVTLLVLGFSFVLISFFIIRLLSYSIIYPLTKLYESMQK